MAVLRPLLGQGYHSSRCPNFWGRLCFSVPEIGRYTNPWDFMPEPLPWNTFKSISKRSFVRVGCVIRRLFARGAAHIETQTQIAALSISKAIGISMERITVIPNSINPEYQESLSVPPDDAGFVNSDDREFYAFCLAADHAHKNLTVIPKVCSILKNKFNIKVIFILTLDCKSNTWRNISSHSSDLGVSDLVINKGKLSVTECISVYRTADFVFLPTLLEVFSATYLEAMTLRVPIVTSDRLFSRDICRDAAIYFNPLDVNDMADKINSLVKEPNRSKVLTDSGIEVLKMFPESATRLKSIYSLFERVVGTEGKPIKDFPQICAKTVMDTSDPSIIFDQNGISNHYWDFQNVVKKSWHTGPEGRAMLEKTVARLKRAGKGRDFDCIMGLSGGADSSYMLHKMVTEFGLRPLVFHVDGGWNSEIAVSNINSLIDKLGLDLYTEVINWEEMRDFQLAMFKSGVPHLDIPQDMAFIGVLYKFAEKHGIKDILNGGNISTECVLVPLEILYWGTDMAQVRDILSRHGTMPMRTYPFCSIFYHKIYLRFFRGVKVHSRPCKIHLTPPDAKSNENPDAG
jgi:glycosyltransferase involved in cell wall biosynthesis